MRLKSFEKRMLFTTLSVMLLFSCSFTRYAESGTIIIDADIALEKLDEGYIALDAQKGSSFRKEHLAGAVNMERRAITTNRPVSSSLASADKVKQAAEGAGLSESSDLIIYDDNKSMDASRLFWTLKSYGHSGDMLIVSGGLTALKEEGASVEEGEVIPEKSTYAIKDLDKSYLIDKDYIKDKIDNPGENYWLIDVRSEEEYNEGTIPGSLHINHEENFFADFSFRPIQHIRIMYKETGVMPEDEIVMYCKSSIRAANTFVALYNAGYRNLKIYDGAWIDWVKAEYPVFVPEPMEEVSVAPQDNS